MVSGKLDEHAALVALLQAQPDGLSSSSPTLRTREYDPGICPRTGGGCP